MSLQHEDPTESQTYNQDIDHAEAEFQKRLADWREIIDRNQDRIAAYERQRASPTARGPWRAVSRGYAADLLGIITWYFVGALTAYGDWLVEVGTSRTEAVRKLETRSGVNDNRGKMREAEVDPESLKAEVYRRKWVPNLRYMGTHEDEYQELFDAGLLGIHWDLRRTFEDHLAKMPAIAGDEHTGIGANQPSSGAQPTRLSRSVDAGEVIDSIHKIAEFRGMDAKAMGAEAGVSDRTVRNAYKTKRATNKTLEKLARGLGVRLNDIAGPLHAERNLQLETCQPLLKSIVSQFLSKGQRASIDREVLMSVANEAAIRAIDGWTPDSGIDLAGRITRNVKTALGRYLEKEYRQEDTLKALPNPQDDSLPARGWRSRMRTNHEAG